ncbi:MAG TPA: hypothetical protein VI815_00460 [Candidatus Nanoarchaeia archaeon]|nr:hypothetical protein [Candidatus Nanoarchaeia archaeon]
MPNSLEDLEKLRLSYTSKLGELFHHKNASDLARLSQNPNYQTFVYDYVSLENITSQFREEFLKCKSALEESANEPQESSSYQKQVDRYWTFIAGVMGVAGKAFKDINKNPKDQIDVLDDNSMCFRDENL